MHPTTIIQQSRYDICKRCDELRPVVRTCRQCGCVMPVKTLFMWASCPIGKWPAMKAEDIQHVMIAAADDPEES